jgi:cell division protein FtsB
LKTKNRSGAAEKQTNEETEKRNEETETHNRKKTEQQIIRKRNKSKCNSNHT